MKKEEKTINIDITISKEAIKNAANNAKRIMDIALEIPVVDPRDLSIDEQIFGIELKPTDDKVTKVTPDTSVHVAVLPIIVDTLSGRAKPGYITVNGTIDIPKESGKVIKLEDCYFANQADAKEVCRAITEVELDRALDREKTEHLNAEFLRKQLTDDRF